MSTPRTYPPETVATWQPRARHFYCQTGFWDADLYQDWIRVQWSIFSDVHGIDQRWGSSVEVHDQFTAWLVARCVCNQTPGECVAGSGGPVTCSIPDG